MTDAARQALEHLRDPSQFQWYVIPLLLLVIYVYAVEVERKNWDVALAGLAFWGMDWFNETWNSVVFHATGRAPVWGAPGHSAYLILIGLNVEICLMFAVFGVVACKMLPADRGLRVLGVPNRVFFAVVMSWLAVGIEVVLNHIGVLTWDWSWWHAGVPYLIFLVGYLPFFVVAYWVHDLTRMRSKLAVLGVIYGVDAVGLVVFGSIGWL